MGRLVWEGGMEMENIGIERCLRDMGMGRGNWVERGSELCGENLGFMLGLLESWKLKKVKFGE